MKKWIDDWITTHEIVTCTICFIDIIQTIGWFAFQHKSFCRAMFNFRPLHSRSEIRPTKFGDLRFQTCIHVNGKVPNVQPYNDKNWFPPKFSVFCPHLTESNCKFIHCGPLIVFQNQFTWMFVGYIYTSNKHITHWSSFLLAKSHMWFLRSVWWSTAAKLLHPRTRKICLASSKSSPRWFLQKWRNMTQFYRADICICITITYMIYIYIHTHIYEMYICYMQYVGKTTKKMKFNLLDMQWYVYAKLYISTQSWFNDSMIQYCWHDWMGFIYAIHG